MLIMCNCSDKIQMTKTAGKTETRITGSCEAWNGNRNGVSEAPCMKSEIEIPHCPAIIANCANKIPDFEFTL